jgi:hypothetical protein
LPPLPIVQRLGSSRPLGAGRPQDSPATAGQRRGEEEGNVRVVACRGTGILPMTFHGRDARATSKAERLPA